MPATYLQPEALIPNSYPTLDDMEVDQTQPPDESRPPRADGGAQKVKEEELKNQTFIPGRNKLEKGQVLEPDASAYELLHRLTSTWPCLSMDIVKDHLGSGRARKKYPATVYSVAGTQAASGRDRENELMVMKMSRLSRMEKDVEGSSDEDSEDDDETSGDPILETKKIKLTACTNRIRARQLSDTESAASTSTTSGPFPLTFAASMSESGSVFIHNVTPHLNSFEVPGTTISPESSKPLYTITAHTRTEGYALSWSPPLPKYANKLHLLTGDTTGRIFLTTCTGPPSAPSSWSTDPKPFTGHTSSVEDLSFSPSEPHVFASASSDGTIRIWDTRTKSRKPLISIQVSNSDVNVLAWSHLTPYLLASGHDDGTFSVWDMRSWKPNPPSAPADPGAPVAHYDFHKAQITSLQWHPSEDSIISVCAGDNTLTLWDLSVEFDDEESKDTADARDVPASLLFVHFSEGVKEGRWHPQMEGCLACTGAEGFGVLRTISV